MDLLDLIILALRILLVALLYVFLVAVLRSAGRGLRQAATDVAAHSQRGPLALVVVEPGGSQLSPGEVIEIADGTTLGRATRADVVLTDAAISAEHARIDRAGRRWVVTDLGSTNGTRVNGARVSGNQALSDGDVLTLGTLKLQVRAQ